MPSLARYRLRQLALDFALAFAYLFGLTHAFGQFARHAHLLPWHPYTTLPDNDVRVVLALESMLVIAPIALLILIGLRAVWDQRLLVRAAGVTLAPSALNALSLYRASDIIGFPAGLHLINAALPTLIPLLMVALLLRFSSRARADA